MPKTNPYCDIDLKNFETDIHGWSFEQIRPDDGICVSRVFALSGTKEQPVIRCRHNEQVWPKFGYGYSETFEFRRLQGIFDGECKDTSNACILLMAALFGLRATHEGGQPNKFTIRDARTDSCKKLVKINRFPVGLVVEDEEHPPMTVNGMMEKLANSELTVPSEFLDAVHSQGLTARGTNDSKRYVILDPSRDKKACILVRGDGYYDPEDYMGYNAMIPSRRPCDLETALEHIAKSLR